MNREIWSSAKLISRFIAFAKCGNIKGVLQCLEEGINPNFIFDDTSALHIAVDTGNFPMLLALIEKAKGLNIDLKTPFGNTPLNLACQRRMGTKFIVLLINNGANPNECNNFEKTPLHSAVMNNSLESAMKLISCNADVNAMDTFGNTPLSIASIDKTYLPMVKLLIKNGANPNLTRESHEPMFITACLTCDDQVALDIIFYLIQNGVDIQCEDPISKNNSLHCTAISSNTKLAVLLLRHRVDIFKVNAEGFTPLMLAHYFGHSTLVTIFEDHIVYLKLLQQLSENKPVSEKKSSSSWKRLKGVLDLSSSLTKHKHKK